MPSPKLDLEKAALLARYNQAQGFGPEDPKVTRIGRKSKPAAPVKKRGPYQKHRHLTSEEKLAEMLESSRLKPLEPAENVPPYDVTRATRYPEVEWKPQESDERLRYILQRYAYAMRGQVITATQFKEWRERFMMMTPEQMGALVRVSARTIRNWENGQNEIPFSMWWVMHCTLQDPEYFLSRPGFHDFYIDHRDGESFLCSSRYPDIRYTAADLFFNRAALNEVFQLRAEVARQSARLDEMTAENTRLRQMLKAKGLTNELQAMHEQLSSLMQKLATADVVDFPDAGTTVEHGDVIHFKQASA